jgi:hypothetical protein
MVLMPLCLVANVLQYVVCCLTLKPVPPGAARPQLTPEAHRRLRPFAGQIDGALQKKITAVHIASQVAPVAGVTPGQVLLFIWSRRNDRQLNRNTGYIVEMPK